MQIVTLGGGGFSGEPDNPLLDRYLLSLSPKPKPKVCFVGTASGDSELYALRFYEGFARFDCTPTHLPLYKPRSNDLRDFVMSQDILYVGGGNTVNLLAIWRAHGIDKLFQEAAENGTLLCGVSAGSICWYESGVTDSYGPTLAAVQNALGFLPGSNCPHYDGEPQRRPTYQRLVAAGELPAGYAADDGCALHFKDGKLLQIVSSRPAARAYRLEQSDEELQEKQLPTQYLG